MRNIFRKSGKEVVQKTVPSKDAPELNIIKANEKIRDLREQLDAKRREPMFLPKETDALPVTDYRYDKSINQLVADADQKATQAELQAEKDAKKKDELVASIRSDPRLFNMGQQMTADAIQAKAEMLRAQDEAKKKYEGTLAKQKQGQMAKELWENGYGYTCSAPIYKMGKEGYSLCFDTDGLHERVFLKTDKAESKWNQLVKTGHPGSPNIVGNHPDATPLTKGEFMALLEGKPSLEQLCSVYSLKYNGNVKITGKEVIAIW